jgi:hypothetical protein
LPVPLLGARVLLPLPAALALGEPRWPVDGRLPLRDGLPTRLTASTTDGIRSRVPTSACTCDSISAVGFGQGKSKRKKGEGRGAGGISIR